MFRFMLSVGLLSASLALVAAGNVRADNPVTQQEVRTRMQSARNAASAGDRAGAETEYRQAFYAAMYLAWYDPNIEASGTDYKGGLALMQEVFDNPPFPGADRGNWNLDIDSFLKQNPRQVLSNASGTTTWRSDNGRATWEVTQNTRLVQGTARLLDASGTEHVWDLYGEGFDGVRVRLTGTERATGTTLAGTVDFGSLENSASFDVIIPGIPNGTFRRVYR